ncbi:MAG: TAXI family TRAP transporter solute-binding subunit [Alphaproteobacteria bacterium]|nr:TAXI family TRAP transporter solute-binding subunit [Alphaproteobacteria bacterium]
MIDFGPARDLDAFHSRTSQTSRESGMKRKLTSIAAALGFGLLSTASSAQTIEFVAGQLGGGWYTMATGMAKLMQDKNPGLQVRVVPGGGTANPTKIQQGQSQLGMGLDIFAKAARDGTVIYQGNPHSKVMMIGQSFSDNYLHVMRAEGATLGFEDIFKTRNIKIGVTKAGSSDEMTYRFVMEHFGTSYDKMRANGARIVQGDYNELASAWKDKHVDYMFIVLGIPGAAVIDMGNGRKGELLAWPDPLAAAMAQKYGYSRGAFPATTYPAFQKAAVPTIIMATTLMVSSDVTEDVAYKVTKTLCEGEAELPKIHASMADFKCATAIKTTPVPVHQGALRYYKERGISS